MNWMPPLWTVAVRSLRRFKIPSTMSAGLACFMGFALAPTALGQVTVSQAACGVPIVCEEAGAPKPGPTRFAFNMVTEFNDPRLYYTGKVMSGFPPQPHLAVWKLDENGVELWRRVRNDPASGIDAYGVAVDADLSGNVYVAGVIERTAGKDIVVLAYSADGTLLWERSFDGRSVSGVSMGDDAPVVIKCGSDGYVYIGGDSQCVSETGTSIGFDYVLLKLFSDTGLPRWGFDTAGQPVVARYNGTAGGDDHLADLVLIPTSASTLGLGGYSVAVTGASPGIGTSTDMTTVLFTDDPAVMEVLRYSPPLNGKDGGTSLALRANPIEGFDTLYVTGYSSGQSAGTGYDFVTVAYGPASPPCVHICPIWAVSYNNSASNGTDIARDIVYFYDSAAGTERLFVTGESWSSTMGFEFATIAYDATTGSPVWSGPQGIVRRFNANDTTGDDPPSDLAVDSAGNLYIVGTSVWGDTPDFSVMSYFPNGDPHRFPDALGREFVTYNGTANGKDFGAAIGLYNEASNPRFGIFGTVYSQDGYGIVRYLQSP